MFNISFSPLKCAHLFNMVSFVSHMSVITIYFWACVQVRSKLSTFSGFGVPAEVTCGGNALKFYASVRMNTKRTGLIKKFEEVKHHGI